MAAALLQILLIFAKGSWPESGLPAEQTKSNVRCCCCCCFSAVESKGGVVCDKVGSYGCDFSTFLQFLAIMSIAAIMICQTDDVHDDDGDDAAATSANVDSLCYYQVHSQMWQNINNGCRVLHQKCQYANAIKINFWKEVQQFIGQARLGEGDEIRQVLGIIFLKIEKILVIFYNKTNFGIIRNNFVHTEKNSE